MSLAETQRAVRDALVDGNLSGVSALIDPRWIARLAIHQRNFEASLVAAVMERFPATKWLVGSPPLHGAARAFVHAHPPPAPCIAEYAETFPAFLGVWPPLAHLGYLTDFATLDWHLGRISVAVDATSAEGTHRMHSAWPIDRLFTKFFSPEGDDVVVAPQNVCLEVRGCRGEFTFSRLPAAEFAARHPSRPGYES